MALRTVFGSTLIAKQRNDATDCTFNAVRVKNSIHGGVVKLGKEKLGSRNARNK
jgi:hypothetical protein